MQRNVAWLVLTMVLAGSLLALLADPDESESDEQTTNTEDITCPEGTEKVSNSSSATGFDCSYPDPHSLEHTHPAPLLTVSNVVDDGSSVTFEGAVDHLHPNELVVEVRLDQQAPVETQPNTTGSWSVVVEFDGPGVLNFVLLASHPSEGTASDPVTVEVTRENTTTSPGSNGTDGGNETNTSTGGGNETNGGGNETNGGGNQSENGTGGGNETNGGDDGNGTGNTTGPNEATQPTYNASDLGQFWLDVFRCQPGHTITQVDDLTTAAVEALECSVSITMNETHITIATNGLPDHDFESTLACSQANDCAAAQNYEWVIPRSPVNDTEGGHDATNCPEANGDYECAAALGEVAIAINGVPFYGPEDGPGGDAVASHHGVYNEDRQPIELGVCHAHSGMGGTFHYHADANCLHWHADEGQSILDYDISTPSAVSANTDNGSHSAVIGVSMDGYPVYGLWGFDENMTVVEMRSSYRLKAGETGYNGIDDYEYVAGLGDLDVCNGHFGPTPEFTDGIYHYHSTMLNGEGEMGFPYFLLCYHGETFLDEGDGGADCSGFGETWGPGIGPPPPGCENEGGGPPPGGQVSSVEPVSSLVYSPLVWVWMGALALVFLRRRG